MKRQWRQFLLAMAMVFGLTSCSTTFVYNNLDWLIHWYIDDYVDLTTEQKSAFDAQLDGWLQWHKESELPRYRAQLSELRERLQQAPMTEQDWLNEYDRAGQHWARLRDTISPDLVPLVRMLTDDQISNIMSALAERDQERIDKRQKARQDHNPQQRFDQSVEEAVEDLERWIGPLNDGQIERVRQYESERRSTFNEWMTYREHWRERVEDVLLTLRQQPEFEQAFFDAMMKPEQFQSERYQQRREHNRQVHAKMMADLHPTLTEKQQRHLNGELNDWIDDVNVMKQP